MDFIGPFLFAAIRMILGALTLLLVLTIQGLIWPQKEVRQQDTKAASDGSVRVRQMSLKRLVRAGFVVGSVLFIAGSLQQIGLVYTTASKGGFLTTLYIVLVPILGMALKHKTHWNTWVSVLIAAFGLYFLCITEAFSIEPGDIVLMISAFFWAGHILATDHLVEGITRRDVMKMCIAQFIVASILCFVFSVFFDRFFAHGAFDMTALIHALPFVLYVGVLSTGIAFTLQAVGQQGISPSAAAIIMSLEAVFSVLGGMIILQEALSGREVLGCVLMFAAVVLSQLPTGQAKHVA